MAEHRPAVSGDTLAYKFDLNGTWTNVEEGSSCGYVANRSSLQRRGQFLHGLGHGRRLGRIERLLTTTGS
jgi:hypothetical protein